MIGFVKRRIGSSSEGEKGSVYLWLVLFAVASVSLLALWPKYLLNQLPEEYDVITSVLSKGCYRYTGGNPPTVMAYSYAAKPQTDDRVEDVDMRSTEPEIAYKLVLQNVLISSKFDDSTAKTLFDDLDKGKVLSSPNGKTFVKDGRTFLIYYPSSHAELSIDKSADPALGHAQRIATWGVVFLIELGQDGKPVYIDGKSIGARGSKYIIADVYQNPSSTPLPDAFVRECQGVGERRNQLRPDKKNISVLDVPTPEPTRIVFPQQEKKSKDKKQLQLEYFIPEGNRQVALGGAWSLHCKPAIYLYPEKEETVSVRVDTKGFLTYVDPPYPASGWIVTAHPDGLVTAFGKTYSYLYYESKVPNELIKKPTEGFVVTYDELPLLYQNILPKLGLNSQQINDFSDYWQKALSKSPYYFVGVLDQRNINDFEPLTIAPKPATMIRVRLYFEALSSYKVVSAPQIETIEKKGFTVVEWGGMVKKDPTHPFTCSQ